MSIATKTECTVAEYLEFERNSESRHEFFEGEISGMTGGTLEHISIISNLRDALRDQLPRPEFLILTSDMRIKVDQNGLYAYPDLLVVKGKPQLEDKSRDTLLNPVVIIEVLSKSTEIYDRTKKFALYQEIPSFQEYVLVAQDRPTVDQFVRDDGGNWRESRYQNLSDSLMFQTIPCSIPLSTIYKNIVFALSGQ